MLIKTIRYVLLPLIFLVSDSHGNVADDSRDQSANSQTGTLEKLVVATGDVSIDLDLGRFASVRSKRNNLRFEIVPDSYFTALVFNHALRGLEPGSMALNCRSSTGLPEPLNVILNSVGDRTTRFN